MSDNFCGIHGEEPVPDKYYKICPECWHCFVTEQELIAKDLKARKETVRSQSWINDLLNIKPWNNLESAESGEDITICPECSHDF